MYTEEVKKDTGKQIRWQVVVNFIQVLIKVNFMPETSSQFKFPVSHCSCCIVENRLTNLIDEVLVDTCWQS